MSIWATDPPASDLDDPYPRDEAERRGPHGESEEEWIESIGTMERLDDIERADLDAATRADAALDEDDTDYDGPGWPF